MFAQNTDSAEVVSKPKEPLNIFSFSDPHSPTKAAIYSAVIPGLGQFYNKKFWKVPVVYVSMGAAAWFMIDQNKQMQKLNKEFKAAYAANPDTIIDVNRIDERNNFRRFRDIGILALGTLYALQIMDATVDAHFYKIDFNQSLSMRIRPTQYQFVSLKYSF